MEKGEETEETAQPAPEKPVISGYGDLHRVVLQGMMSAGFLDTDGVKTLFSNAFKGLKLPPIQNNREFILIIQRVVTEINEEIKPYDMAIRSSICELTSKKYYVFLVAVEKPIMRMQTIFTKMELELLQKIMTAVLRKSHNFAIPYSDCLNFRQEIDSRNFSLEMAHEFINKMISLQYLTMYYPKPNEDNYLITIGFRTIREFEPILREMYDGVMTKCSLCKMLALHGVLCKCGLFVHRGCFTKYMKNKQNQKPICPDCKIAWKEEEMITRTRQDDTSGATNLPSTSSSAGVKKGSRSVTPPITRTPEKAKKAWSTCPARRRKPGRSGSRLSTSSARLSGSSSSSSSLESASSASSSDEEES